MNPIFTDGYIHNLRLKSSTIITICNYSNAENEVDRAIKDTIASSSEFRTINVEQTPFIVAICKLYELKSATFLYAESIKKMEMTTIMFKPLRDKYFLVKRFSAQIYTFHNCKNHDIT
ncbi:glutamate receptor 2-like [Vespula maculifrons]|uniref:Glutamate receptor 2-like n=1 Tax=Vespula maculifrons TaxID=7453 RepID=A0ABD2CW24_VESMC